LPISLATAATTHQRLLGLQFDDDFTVVFGDFLILRAAMRTHHRIFRHALPALVASDQVFGRSLGFGSALRFTRRFRRTSPRFGEVVLLLVIADVVLDGTLNWSELLFGGSEELIERRVDERMMLERQTMRGKVARFDEVAHIRWRFVHDAPNLIGELDALQRVAVVSGREFLGIVVLPLEGNGVDAGMPLLLTERLDAVSNRFLHLVAECRFLHRDDAAILRR